MFKFKCLFTSMMLLALMLALGCDLFQEVAPAPVSSAQQNARHKEGIAAETNISAEKSGDNTDTNSINEENLIIYTVPDKYTYNDFLNDIALLKNNYENIVNINNLCYTVDGRSVYDITVGDPVSENHVLVFGEMHAREYITSQIVMRLLCKTINGVLGSENDYNGVPVKELLKDVCIHFVPVSNPDGMAISQFGLNGLNKGSVRENVSSMSAYEGYEQWKSNANGVDLNRNFDADWADYIGTGIPSAERYKGAYPGCENESKALITLTQRCNMKRTISYHTCGALIYWYYKQDGAVLDQSRRFAERISETTGYPLDSDYTAVDAAGYKDWAVYKMDIPSITIETGAENGYSIVNPVPISRFGNIWKHNQDVIWATLYNLKYE